MKLTQKHYLEKLTRLIENCGGLEAAQYSDEYDDIARHLRGPHMTKEEIKRRVKLGVPSSEPNYIQVAKLVRRFPGFTGYKLTQNTYGPLCWRMTMYRELHVAESAGLIASRLFWKDRDSGEIIEQLPGSLPLYQTCNFYKQAWYPTDKAMKL